MAEAAPARAPVKVRFYRFRNRLKEKTAGLGGKATGVSEEALAAAERALAELAEDYPDWVSGLISKLAEQHSRCVDTPDKRREYFEEINRIAHDMKGQGGTFGYPLITDFADSLYTFTTARSEITDSMVELVKAHIDAMRVVIKDRVEGDGGEVGVALKQSLDQAILKHKTRG